MWVQEGILIEITSKKGPAKIHSLSLICSLNCIKNIKTIYIDASANFRPELIEFMIGKITGSDIKETKKLLQNIRYIRVYDLDQLANLLDKIKLLDVNFIIFDEIISLFLHRTEQNIRLKVRKIVRDLAIIAISKKITIIFTNIVFEKKINELVHSRYEIFYHDIIRYVHIKISVHFTSLKEKILEFEVIYPKSLKNSSFLVDLNLI